MKWNDKQHIYGLIKDIYIYICPIKSAPIACFMIFVTNTGKASINITSIDSPRSLLRAMYNFNQAVRFLPCARRSSIKQHAAAQIEKEFRDSCACIYKYTKSCTYNFLSVGDGPFEEYQRDVTGNYYCFFLQFQCLSICAVRYCLCRIGFKTVLTFRFPQGINALFKYRPTLATQRAINTHWRHTAHRDWQLRSLYLKPSEFFGGVSLKTNQINNKKGKTN